MKVQGDRHQHHHAHEPQEQKGGQQGEMAKMRNARRRNGLGLREGLKQLRWLFGVSCGIPGLRSEISTPRTKTCPWGPRIWGTHIFWRDRNILFRLVRRVFEIVHGSIDFFLRVADYFGAVVFFVVRLRVTGSLVIDCRDDGAGSWFPTQSATFSAKSCGLDGAPNICGVPASVSSKRPLLEV